MKALMIAVTSLVVFACVLVPAGIHAQPVSPALREVARSETLVLEIYQDAVSFRVTDLRNGATWSSEVDDSHPAYGSANTLWRDQMRSLFTFGYTNRDDEYGARRISSLVRERYTAEIRPLPRGVAIDIDLTAIDIALTVELTLSGDELSYRIPMDRITEYGSNMLLGIAPAPFFGYADEDDEGYFVLPDGCGALYRFKTTRPSSVADEKQLAWYLYGPEDVDFRIYQERAMDDLKSAHIPVFGVRRNGAAFVAIVEEGDADAYVRFAESGSSVRLNRVYADFVVRHSFELYLSEISVHGAGSQNASPPIRYDNEPIRLDREIRYTFLAGDEADYGGMAAVYRDRITSHGLPAASDLPVALTLFGGIVEDRLLVDRYVAMTTFAEAETIIDSLGDRGLSKLFVNLVGWSEGGYGMFPILWPPDRRLGGRRGLASLARLAAGRGALLYLEVDAITAIRGNERFNTRRDVVREGNGLPVRDLASDTFLLSAAFARDRIDELTVELSGFPGVSGLSFSRIGVTTWHDYQDRSRSDRIQIIETWREALALSRERLGGAAVHGAQIDLALEADIIHRLPLETSGFVVLDEGIPFLQMIIHGSVWYAGDPANLFHDTNRQFLRWIEYGCIPHYELTWERSELLSHTRYNELFTSRFADWAPVVAEHSARLNRDLAGFYHLPIVDHEREGELVVVAYADGSRIYINYANAGMEFEGVEIDPQDYAVVRGAGE